MTVNQKRKGHDWERDAAKLLQSLINDSHWKRVAGSGAIGTIMNEPLLFSDVTGTVPGLSKSFRVDAKVGYGGHKQMALKREWIEKIREEAEGANGYPMIIGKFSGARGKSRQFVALDVDTFADIMNEIGEMNSTIESLLKKLETRDEQELEIY